MSSELINRSPDLRRLRDEGFEISVAAGYLVLAHVPYVTSQGTVAYGSLVSELTLAGDRTARPSNHMVFFDGVAPCHRNGSPITGIQHSEGIQQLAPGVTVHRSFSNKPPSGYADYYQKMTRYVEILSAAALSLDPSVRAQTYRPLSSDDKISPFVYVDTNASRGHFQSSSERLAGQKIAIVGLGGTGSYVLDLVAKTPVAEIRLFDGDRFLQHNAFRAPGAPSLEELAAGSTKVEYLARIYSRMHRGVLPYHKKVGAGDTADLNGLNFVFICIDHGPTKKHLLDFLIEERISFVDVGMGVQTADEKLIGIVRVSTGTPAKHDHLSARVSYDDPVDDAYSTNIQIADLNMLNASLAVIKWKKLCGFYADLEHEHHSTYTIDGNMLLNEEIHPPVR
jgi:hypothetical protein